MTWWTDWQIPHRRSLPPQRLWRATAQAEASGAAPGTADGAQLAEDAEEAASASFRDDTPLPEDTPYAYVSYAGLGA